MSKPDQDFDWSVATWEGSRRAQLHRALAFTLRERLEAMEGLAEVARRFAEMRARGRFRYCADSPADTIPGVAEPSVSEPRE
jgi:hypothetical protein